MAVGLLASVLAATTTLTAHPHPPPDPIRLIGAYGLRMAAIRSCESGGDYGAVNEAVSETHDDGTVGSYGAYQIWPALWAETIIQWMGRTWAPWAEVRPDRAHPAIQDAVAAVIWWRLGTIAWRHGGKCERVGPAEHG